MTKFKKKSEKSTLIDFSTPKRIYSGSKCYPLHPLHLLQCSEQAQKAWGFSASIAVMFVSSMLIVVFFDKASHIHDIQSSGTIVNVECLSYPIGYFMNFTIQSNASLVYFLWDVDVIGTSYPGCNMTLPILVGCCDQEIGSKVWLLHSPDAAGNITEISPRRFYSVVYTVLWIIMIGTTGMGWFACIWLMLS